MPQPVATQLNVACRNWCKENLIYVFFPSSSTDSHGLPSGGGLWLRPQDIIYIDRKFCSDFASIRHLSLRNISRLAIDASLLSPPQHVISVRHGILGRDMMMELLLTSPEQKSPNSTTWAMFAAIL